MAIAKALFTYFDDVPRSTTRRHLSPGDTMQTNVFFSDLVGPFPDVLWEPDFLTPQAHQDLLRYCLDELPWKITHMSFGGKPVAVPRQLAWFGDVPYYYSGIKHEAAPMPTTLVSLKRKIEAYLQSQGIDRQLNSVLLNHYRSGADSIGMHADDERQLHSQPVIASISLGDPRTFVFQHKSTGLRHKSPLTGGSLLVMKGTCQDDWRHGIPKEPGPSERVNLTFRFTHE
jgi:alkylated DNA repair dioxygenase AlkB